MAQGRPPRIPQRIKPQPPRFAAIPAKFQHAVAFHQLGDLTRAESLYREILRQAPAHSDALHLLGVAQYQRGRHQAAVDLIGRAIKINPGNAAAHLNIGNALLGLKRSEDALASYDRALALKPEYPEALNNRGNALRDLKRPEEALASLERALKLKPDYADAFNNRGVALLDLKRQQEALASIDGALALKPEYAEALNNRGNALRDLKRPEEALASLDRALALKPDYVEALNNRGNALLDLKQPEDALLSFDRALALKPNYADALNNRGAALLQLKRHEDAGKSFARLVEIVPEYDYALGNMFHSQLHGCNWAHYAQNAERIVQAVTDGKKADNPFPFLAVSHSAAAQLRCSRTYVAHMYPAFPAPLWAGERYAHERIRVAYISADFREHAVSYLTAGLLERHDRERFETVAISLCPEEKSVAGQRVKSAFGRFVDVTRMSDREVAALMRELEVDIAVDLLGFTQDNRTAIFAHRAAPIQVNYLGFPATMGAEYIDYIVADRFVIPEDKRACYAEQVVYLPESFQANDDKRRISERLPTRAEAGLPESGFVFCSFNNSYKINPPVFDVWMRLLVAVSGSVLWLVADSDTVKNNLRREAADRSVDPARLIFAPRLVYADHLARFQLADLFLDTLPFNAGTTASDALWAGVPVLTCAGEAFAARMAGSLLNAVGLPELITYSMEEYEALGLKLATTPGMLTEVRTRLARNRTTYPLFDTDRFRRHIESAYVTMWERHQRGDPPASFAVQPVGGDSSRTTSSSNMAEARPARIFHQPRQVRRAVSQPASAVTAKLQKALACHQRGELIQAEFFYREILAQMPDHFDVLHMLGVIEAQRKNPAAAVKFIDHALRVKPDYPEALSNRGVAQRNLKRHEEALASFDRALALKPDYAEALSNRGLALRDLQRHEEALASFDRALALKPDYAEAHSNRGLALRDLNRLEEALASHDRALQLKPDHAEALYNRGNALRDLKRHEEALASFDRALQLKPDHAEALNDRGVALRELKRHEEALASFDGALQFTPDSAEALNNRGNALRDLQRHEEALASFDRALQLKPDDADVLNNRGTALLDLKRPEDALASYERALRLKPDYAEALSNRGLALRELKRHEEALASFDRALALRPDYAEALSNRGLALRDLKRHEEALASFDRALQLNPDFAEALNNRGNVLGDSKRHEDAAQSFARLLEIVPDYDYALGKLLRSRLYCCNWTHYARNVARIVQAVTAANKANAPFSFLAVSSAAAAQLQCARVFVVDKYPASPTRFWTGERYQHDRIRVAYLSADFRDHPVAYLTVGLYEKHDRERFETIAISLNPEELSMTRQRVKAAFSRFIDVSGKSDQDVAALLRELEVDIAVDLTGFTSDGRTGIFAHRPAPIQVNYLGFPGTMSAEYIDYIIADEFVVPRDKRAYYSEQVVYLPESFQANDDKRRISERVPSRPEAGLPESAFVFCSFNNTYKLNPPVFDVWMRLLKAVPGSVLWLVAGSLSVQDNLRREAENRGVEPDRLIFAPRLPYADHLARFRLADLFLDTLPFNAGTTASDALWAGVPVLTCAGEAFAARMAGSLLNAVGLPELVTYSMEEYEALALKLATAPGMLAELRARLAQNRTTYPLFDTDRFRRHLEAAYIAMWERYQRGEPPESFAVQAIA